MRYWHDQMNWLPRRYGTPSHGTGPSHDNTGECLIADDFEPRTAPESGDVKRAPKAVAFDVRVPCVAQERLCLWSLFTRNISAGN